MRTIDYFYHSDFSQVSDALRQLPVGPLGKSSALALASVLSMIDRGANANKWTSHEASEFSLLKAKITYNGPNSQSFQSKSIFTNVLKLEFDTDGYAPFGVFVLQYNTAPEAPVVSDSAVTEQPGE